MNLPILIYCYDAYCGWCFGFGKMITSLEKKYIDTLQFETIAGGMVTPEQPVHLSISANYILNAIPKVEEITGVKFGSDYKWHLENPTDTDWYPDSTKPAIAACIIKEKNPLLQIKFIEAIQFALFVEGRDLTDDEAYRHLLPLLDITADEFYVKLKEEKYLVEAQKEFDICKQLQVQGFPAIFLQNTDGKTYAIASGYTSVEAISAKIDSIISA